MAVSVVPALIDAVFTAATTALVGVATVTDGFAVDSDPGNFLMIGIDDPESSNPGASAQSAQDWQSTGQSGARSEIGDVSCVAVGWNGEYNQKTARDAAYGIAETVAAILRATPALGIPSLLWTSYGTNTQLFQDQNDGAIARVVFTIHFRAYL